MKNKYITAPEGNDEEYNYYEDLCESAVSQIRDILPEHTETYRNFAGNSHNFYLKMPFDVVHNNVDYKYYAIHIFYTAGLAVFITLNCAEQDMYNTHQDDVTQLCDDYSKRVIYQYGGLDKPKEKIQSGIGKIPDLRMARLFLSMIHILNPESELTLYDVYGDGPDEIVESLSAYTVAPENGLTDDPEDEDNWIEDIFIPGYEEIKNVLPGGHITT